MTAKGLLAPQFSQVSQAERAQCSWRRAAQSRARGTQWEPALPTQGWTQLSFQLSNVWGTRPPTGETSDGKHPAELRPGQETRAAAPVSLGLRASWLHSSRETPYKPSGPRRGPSQPSPSPRSACPPGRRPLRRCGSPNTSGAPRIPRARRCFHLPCWAARSWLSGLGLALDLPEPQPP